MLLTILFAAWPISEIVLGFAKRARHSNASVRDRGSLAVLWTVIVISVASGIILQSVGPGRMAASPRTIQVIAVVLLVIGLIIRWGSILTLGRLFSTSVAIQADHRIIRSGPYRVVRHPSYSGLLLAFAGLGVAYGSWLSLTVIIIPITAALLYRIHVEEHALLESFGSEYSDYRRTTKRLIPWVY